MSYVTLNDGNTSVDIPIEASLGLQISIRLKGDFIRTEVNGGISLKHCFYQKDEIDVTGHGPIPPGIKDLQYANAMTLTIPVLDNVRNLSVFCNRPTITYNHSDSSISWSIKCEET